MNSFQLDFRSPPGYDRTRGVEIGNKNFELTHLEEAYTSEHWLVRIYKVKDLDNKVKAKPVKPVKKSRKKSSKKVCVKYLFLTFSIIILFLPCLINEKFMSEIDSYTPMHSDQTMILWGFHSSLRFCIKHIHVGLKFCIITLASACFDYMGPVKRKCVFGDFRPGMTQTGLLSYSD